MNTKVKELFDLFEHFIQNQWIYESKQIYLYLQKMCKEEIEEFIMDPKLIDWNYYFH